MKALSVIAWTIFAVLSAPLLAQSDTGTRIGGKPAQLADRGSNEQRARGWLQGYAACVSKRYSKRVETLLDAGLDARTPFSKIVDGTYDPCLSEGGTADELLMSSRLLRGALYADRVKRTTRRLDAAALPAAMLAFPSASMLDGDAKARVSLVRFGECVMRRDPGEALAFVRADAGNASETKSLARLVPAISPCIDKGAQVRLSRSVLEAALAEAIDRTLRLSVPAAK